MPLQDVRRSSSRARRVQVKVSPASAIVQTRCRRSGRPGESASEEELRAWCSNPKTGLASYRVPRSFVFRDSLPETLIGKVLRRQLLEEEKAAVAAGV